MEAPARKTKRSPPQRTTHWRPVPRELAPDLAVSLALLNTEEGREYIGAALEEWAKIGGRLAEKPWRNLTDRALIALVLGQDRPVRRALGAFLGSAPPWTNHLLLLLAYFGRALQRVTQGEDIRREMAYLWAWLYGSAELHRRLNRHPLGKLLWAIVTGTRDPSPGAPDWSASTSHQADQLTTQWLRRAALTLSISVGESGRGRLGEGTAWTRPRRGTHGPQWLRGVLGETDPLAAREEALGLLRVRLAEEVKRLRRLPPQEIAGKAVAGLLNYHKVAAEQAILRGQRGERDRHEQLEKPDSIQDPSATSALEGALERAVAETADPERAAAAVIRVFRLPPAQARVVRYIAASPKDLPDPAIARNTGLSLSTVKAAKATIRRLAGDKATLLRILSSK